MGDERYSYERCVRIWNDDHGDHIYVGPDSDGLELLELRDIDSDGKETHRFTMTPTQARLIARALLELTETK